MDKSVRLKSEVEAAGNEAQESSCSKIDGDDLDQTATQLPASKTTAQAKMQMRTSQVDQEELVRLVQVEAMELPDLGLVVSGMAGRFPKCDSVNEFEENLRLGRDMINDQDNARFTCGLWGLPPRAGRLKDLSQFDYEFFGFTLEEANYVDFQLRILYEVVYESILDAGLNPANLRGSNTGVFFGLHCNEFENAMADDPAFRSNGYYAQFAVKVAQYFDLRGLTLTFDAACASGFVGLHSAVEALRDGICDQAIVCSSNIPVHPTGSFIFYQMQMLSPTGFSRFLDSRADGYVKSEACVSVLLQREQVAKRNYASFMATMTSVDGYKPEGITFPSDKSQESLIRATKEMARVSTNHVEYLEAHGTGTPAGDPQEARAISNVYYAEEETSATGVAGEQRRIGPLLVGSVKTSMGHSEAASGLCALVKVALMFENEIIYRNLHFDQPNTNIGPLMDGRLKFVGEPLPLKSRIIPLSCYGFGGSNVHAICRANRRERIPELGSQSSQHLITTGGLPRLVLMFGRGQQEVESFFKQLLDADSHQTRNCLTDDFLSLIDSLNSGEIDRLMNYRGFCLLDARQRRQLVTSVKRCDLRAKCLELGEDKVQDLGRRIHHQEAQARRCHLAFSGLGCQWAGMGAGLVCLRPFWSSIERAAELLEPFKSERLDLVEFLTKHQDQAAKAATKSDGPNLCLAFVSIVAYQLALVNLVRGTLKVKQLGSLVGHSLGEIACAYASNLFDEREALMVAYQLGKALDELGPLVSGKMLAIAGLEWQQVVKVVELHQDVYKSLRVSCINGPNSVTISGRAQEVDEFMLVEMELYRQSMMVFEVSSQVALHNEFIMDRREIRTALRRALERVLLPLTDYDRTKTSWISGFLNRAGNSQSERDLELAKQANVDYFIEMLCRPIDMVTALGQLEPDSTIYELSPSNSLESQIIQLQCEQVSPPASGSTGSRRRKSSTASLGQQQRRLTSARTKQKFHYVKSMQKNLDPQKQLVRLLSSFGELYQLGATFDLANLYKLQTGKQAQFPVRRQTPSISSLFRWQHSNSVFVPRYPIQFSKSSAKCEMPIDLVQDRDKYLAGHCVDGRVLYPATGYLLLVWRVFSFTKRKIYDACFQDIERELMPVEFRNVRLLRAVILGQHLTQLYVHFEEATGKFEVKEGGSVVVEGYAMSPQERPEGLLYEDVRFRLDKEKLARREDEETIELNKEDVYKQFRVHGYDYGDTFQCIESSSFDGLASRIKFNGHFVSLTDSILQSIFLTITRCAPAGSLFLPTRFDYVRFQPEIILKRLHEVGMSIDQSDGSLNTRAKREMMSKIMQRDSEFQSHQTAPEVGEDQVKGEEENEQEEQKPDCFFETFCDPQTGIIITDGIEMRGVKASPAPRRLDNSEVLLESYQFVQDCELPVEDERLTRFEALVRPYARACDSMSLTLLMRVFGLKSSSQLSCLLTNETQLEQTTSLMDEREIEAYKREHLTNLYDLSNDDQNDKLQDNSLQQAQDEAINKYDIKRNGKRTLISILDQLIKMNEFKKLPTVKLRELIHLNRNHLTRDLLQATFTTERFVRPLIETVLENVCLRKSRVRLLEVNPDDGIMRPALQQLVQQIEPNLTLDYSLAHPNPNQLHGSLATPIGSAAPSSGANNKTFTLKLDNLDSLFSDHQLKGLDLIVFKDQSCYRAGEQQQQDLRQKLNQTLATLSQALAPGGYCLLLMRNKMTLAERVVLALENQTALDFGQLAREVNQMNELLAERCSKFELEICKAEEELQKQFKLHLTAKKSDQNGCLMLLLRRIGSANWNLQDPSQSQLAVQTQQQHQQVVKVERVFLRVRHDQLDWLDELKEIFKAQESSEPTEEVEPDEQDQTTQPKQVWLCAVATRQNPISGLIGMVQALRKELGSSNLRCYHDAFTFAHLNESNVSLDQIKASELFQEALRRDHIWNCVDSNGRLGSFRHFTINDYLSPDEFLCVNQKKGDSNQLELKVVETQKNHLPTSAFVNNLTRGDLSSFAWFEAPHKYLSEQQQRDQLVRVAYSALNFRDVMLATGRLPLDAIPLKLAMSDCQLGLEFSGHDGRGRRVMGMVEGRGIATHVLCPRESSIIIELPDWLSLREAATIPIVYATVIMAMIIRGRARPGESILIHAGSGGVGQAAIRLALHYKLEVFTTVGSQEKRQFLLDQFSASGLQQDHIFDSRSCQFEADILLATRGRGVDLILNSLADDKLQASLNCLADGGRFLEIGKYDMSVDARLELLKLESNKSFHGILVDKLFDTDELNDSFKNQLRVVLDTLKRGLREGFIKPIQNELFKSHQVEEAFRFMATGKHIGKVLIEIDASLENEHKQLDRRICCGFRPKAVPRLQLSPEDSFIVTGGLGGFGLELCKWLAQQGARRLVITSRHGLRTGYQRATLRRLEQGLGVKILIITEHEADASQLDGAKKLLQISSELAPSERVGGIFHLAMVLRDTLLENMSREDFELVLRPKVLACLALNEATRELRLKLDYFVAFSSVTSGKGNAGQANYAYANSCLERICEQRRAHGQHALAIQWGAIGDVGVAFENLGGNEVIIGGTIPQRVPSCMATLSKLLATPFSTCLSVVPVNRNQEALSERGDLVGAIMHVLGIKDPSKVSEEATLGDLGLDSLMAVEIRQYIEREHDITLNIQEIRALTIGRIREISERPPQTGGSAGTGIGGQSNQVPDAKRQAASYGKQPEAVGSNAGSKRTTNRTSVRKQNHATNSSLDGKLSAQLQQSSLALLDKNMVSSFVPALELPADDFCPLNFKDINSNQQTLEPIFFLPPIHGRFEQLHSVCAQIQRPCVGLNWTRKLGHAQTVDEAVEIYLNLLEQFDWTLSQLNWSKQSASGKKRNGNGGNTNERTVNLVGYSFGATIAFELMVAIEKRQNLHQNQLERRLSNGSQRPPMEEIVAAATGLSGRNVLRAGRLILLDGSPKQIELGSQYLADLTRKRPLKLEDKVDELLIVYVMANVRSLIQKRQNSPTEQLDYLKLLNELKARGSDLRAKVEFASERLASLLQPLDDIVKDNANREQQLQARKQSLFYAMEAFLRRYELINSYKVRRRLSSDCTLIRAEKLYLRKEQTSDGCEQTIRYNEDLDLTSVVTGRVELFIMPGDHESFLSENELEIGRIIAGAQTEARRTGNSADQLAAQCPAA